MFRFEKEKIQLKSVEDYLRTQEILGAASENGKTGGELRAFLAAVKPLALPIIIVLAVLFVVVAAFSQIMGLRAEVATLKARKDVDVKALQQQVIGLVSTVDRSQKQIQALRGNIAELQADLEAEKVERQRVAAAAAAARKAATADRKRNRR